MNPIIIIRKKEDFMNKTMKKTKRENLTKKKCDRRNKIKQKSECEKIQDRKGKNIKKIVHCQVIIFSLISLRISVIFKIFFPFYIARIPLAMRKI